MTGLVLVVFAAVYLGMALGRWPGLKVDRTGIALLGAIVLYGSGALDGAAVLAAIDFPTLVILFGLMILSAQFAACGFYDWCSTRIATADVPAAGLLAITVAAAGILAAVLANDVVVFAMTPMLCAGLIRRGLDPRPFVIALAGGANAGSAATIIGNPQNILIGEIGQLDFWRFLSVCAPPALAGLASVFLVVWWRWRGRFEVKPLPREGALQLPLDRPGVVKASFATVLLLVLFATPLPHVEGV
ncbi:MAG TPA: SLC13 family permease, partial [Geminicoccaceae bacterium]|nr:SLC13 family permease [Geminicoccaceae bacterium]